MRSTSRCMDKISVVPTTFWTCSKGSPPCFRRRISISSSNLGYPIVRHTIKRSIWDSGRSCVPADPTGFCVAITIYGLGVSRVTPSTVMRPSSITSRSAACVLLDVRLISSAKKRLHRAAPGLYSSWPVDLLYTEKPVTSVGITSGVNCIRR